LRDAFHGAAADMPEAGWRFNHPVSIGTRQFAFTHIGLMTREMNTWHVRVHCTGICV
jgi:hypothetical protein